MCPRLKSSGGLASTQNDLPLAAKLPSIPGFHPGGMFPERIFGQESDAVRVGEIEKQRQQRCHNDNQQQIKGAKAPHLFDFLLEQLLQADSGYFQKPDLLTRLGQVCDGMPQCIICKGQVRVKGLHGFISPDVL